MPGNMAGGPGGPGASPATSPGAGAGMQATADAMIKAVMPAMHRSLSAYPIGSPKYKSLLKAIQALSEGFGEDRDNGLVPSAIMNLANQAKSPRGKPPMPPPGAMGGGGQGIPPGAPPGE